MLVSNVSDVATFEQLKKKGEKWVHVTVEMLKQLFSDESKANYFESQRTLRFTNSFFPISLGVQIQDFVDNFNNYINALDAILESLKVIPEASMEAHETDPAKFTSNNVFIVHGHDELLKESVARLLTKLDLNPIILHEQASGGRTLIEKIEGHSDVSFAVVLLTPDDCGACNVDINKQDSAENKLKALKCRARQNVVFELGFFFGKIGRGHVCALYKDGTEKPSDIDGIIYIPIDENGAWHLALAKEISGAGLKVDLNKLLPG